MRRIVTTIISFIMGAMLIVPVCHAESRSNNTFSIYAVSGMHISIQASSNLNPDSGGYIYETDYEFTSGSTHYADPYVISSSVISQWYSNGVKHLVVSCDSSSAITLSSPDSIISGTEMVRISSDDGTSLSFITKLLSLQRMYLFPIGSAPNVAGVTPTPFVNNGSDIVVDDNELNNTIGSVNEFRPFMQFIFVSVIPWAGFAGLIILVFATIKFMLKG